MSPLLPLLVVGALVAAAVGSRKSRKAAAAGSMKDLTEVGQVYQRAMDPTMLDLDWLRSAVAFLQSQGATDLAANVSSRIASIQAAAGAQAAGKAEADAARRAWEAQNGGAPTQAQLDLVWSKVVSGEIERDPNGKAVSIYAWTLFKVYGTPDREAVAKVLMDRMAAPAAVPSAVPTPTVLVDNKAAGTVVPVAPSPEIEVAPKPAPSAVPAPAYAPPPPPPPSGGMPGPAADYTAPQDTVKAPVPVAKAETAPAVDTNGTIALARQMIAIEESKGWKTALSSEIKAWQGRVGLNNDAKFGPKSGQRMALEVGVLPLIRYWPKGSTLKTALAAYRDDLFTTAANLDQAGQPEHAAALRVSADHETGQGYPAAPKAVPASTRIAQATKVAAAVGAVGSGNLAQLQADVLYRPNAPASAVEHDPQDLEAWRVRLGLPDSATAAQIDAARVKTSDEAAKAAFYADMNQ